MSFLQRAKDVLNKQQHPVDRASNSNGSNLQLGASITDLKGGTQSGSVATSKDKIDTVKSSSTASNSDQQQQQQLLLKLQQEVIHLKGELDLMKDYQTQNAALKQQMQRDDHDRQKQSKVIIQLQDQLAQSVNTIGQLQQQQQTMNLSLKPTHEKIDVDEQVQVQIAQLQAQLRSSQQSHQMELSDLETRLQTANEQLVNLENSSLKLETQDSNQDVIMGLRRQNQLLTEQCKQLEERLTALQLERNALNSQLSKVISNQSPQVDASAQIAQLEEQLNSLNKFNADLTEQNERLQQQVDSNLQDLQQQKDMAEQQVATLNEVHEQELASALQVKESIYAQQLELLQNELAAKHSIELTEKLNKLQSDHLQVIEQKNIQLNNMQAQVDEAKNQVALAQLQLAQQTTLFQQQSEEHEKLNQAYFKSNQVLESKEAELKILQDSVIETEQKLLSQSTAFEQAQLQIKQQNEICREFQKQIEVLQASQAEISNSVTRSKYENDKLKLDLEQAQNLSKTQADEHTQLTKKIADLENLTAAKGQEVAKLTTTLHDLQLVHDQLSADYKALEKKQSLVVKELQKMLKPNASAQKVTYTSGSDEVETVQQPQTSSANTKHETVQQLNEKLLKLQKELDLKQKVIMQHVLQQQQATKQSRPSSSASLNHDNNKLVSMLQGPKTIETLTEINVKMQTIVTDLTTKNFVMEEEINGLKDLIRNLAALSPSSQSKPVQNKK